MLFKKSKMQMEKSYFCYKYICVYYIKGNQLNIWLLNYKIIIVFRSLSSIRKIMSTQKKNFSRKTHAQIANRNNYKKESKGMNLIQKLSEIKKFNKLNQKAAVHNECKYGSSCAHLRVKGQCQFLHQRKDYLFLSLSLPQNFLEDQEPLKKSKQQRKQDKIRQKAERQQRGKARLQHKQLEQKQQVKKIQNIDIKEQIVQNLLSTLEGQKLSYQKLYKNINILIEAYVKKSQYPFTEPNSEQLLKINFTFSEIRKRLLIKMKKKEQLAAIYKQFLQKQSIIIKKIIKNVQKAYEEEIQIATNSQALSVIDFKEIEERILFKEIQQILNSKKQNLDLISYYSKYFEKDFGFPINSQSYQSEQSINQGGLLPLINISILFLTSPQILIAKNRIFYTYPLSKISQNQIKGVIELKNLLIPFKILNKEAIQKNLVIYLPNVSFKNICIQIMMQNMSEFHQKMKAPGDFVFGNLTQNIKKFKAFIIKYKQKLIVENKQNMIILVVVGLQNLVQKLWSKELDLQKLKQERNLEEQNLYQKAFLLKQMIDILGDKVVYLDQKKLKIKKYSKQLLQIDNKLILEPKSQMVQQQK